MIRIEQVNSWHDFEAVVAALRPAPVPHAEAPIAVPRMAFQKHGELLFRGQQNAAWDLKTTLERSSSVPFACDSYQLIMRLVKDEIEVFTDRSWTWVDQSALHHKLPDSVAERFPAQVTSPAENFANFGFMAYLRHYGFPSPLLDWTRSHYIAAYFAASGHSPEPWAIYVFDERPRGFKVVSASGHAPEITAVSQRDAFQRRHFLQQSTYTVCTAYDKNWCFVQHDSVLNRDKDDQDLLVKCVFPASMRPEIMRLLNKMNINAYSLFGTEEALLQALGNRHFSLQYTGKE
jgi:hypothetical protein